jgi:nitrogen-specific signal transduction histidine kinase
MALAVADNGRGMPPEIRDRLFSAKAVSSKKGGTGLGTKIVKDVVDAHKRRSGWKASLVWPRHSISGFPSAHDTHAQFR